jgi:hypothetical protein
MEYIVTLIETTVHTVVVQSNEVGIKLDDDARRQWINGYAVDSDPRLLSLEVTDITTVPMEDVA